MGRKKKATQNHLLYEAQYSPSAPPSSLLTSPTAPPPEMRRRTHHHHHLLFFHAILLIGFAYGSEPDPCDPGSLPDPLTLRPDQLTVLLSGYSEARLPLLRSLAASYSSSPLVAAVLVLWGNPSTPASALHPSLFPSTGAAPISVLRHPSPSLNARFLPRAAVRTRAVAVCDDDVEVDHRSLALAFAIWRSRDRGLVGFFARSHDLDLEAKTWIYTVHHDRYSIVLTKFMILRTEYLFRYSCGSNLSGARRLVDWLRNCEDILMNFVAAMEGEEGPVLVDGRRIIDWGDPRNSGSDDNNSSSSRPLVLTEEEGIRRVGLSSKKDHMKTRGRCIREFHRMLGVMPLRYSFGKVGEGIREQGLCHKGGKLVYCDEH